MSKYLVTGASGFIGSCLVRELVNQGEKVHILTRQKKLNWRLFDLSKKIEIFTIDLINEKLIDIVKEINPDFVFHLAVYGSLPSENNFSKMIYNNLNGTANLIEALKKTSFKLMINAGSSSEYGIKKDKMNENDLLSPVNDYGVVKASQTLYCQKSAIREDLPIITFRLFSPYGYYEDQKRLIPTIILHALNNKPIPLSSPSNVRDYIFIEDVVSVYLKGIKIKFSPGTVLNIGSGKQNQTIEVVKKIISIAGSQSKPLWNFYSPQQRQIEPKIWQGDIKKVKKIIPWIPKYNIDDGLKKTIEWFKKNIKLYA